MRDYQKELEKRVAFIREALKDAHADGIVYGNSGGKDSALVGILCKKACDNVLGIMLPCQSKQNFGQDMEDGIAVAEQFQIETATIDLTKVKEELAAAIGGLTDITPMASANIAPRLRMAALYAVAQTRNSLVAGTGNASERYMGYFTKWGDGACDFNPIADLTVTEVFAFLRFLNAPVSIIEKAPSAGLFEGQTDEKEMGVTYREIDAFMENGGGTPESVEKIEKAHARSEHKRVMPKLYEE